MARGFQVPVGHSKERREALTGFGRFRYNALVVVGRCQEAGDSVVLFESVITVEWPFLVMAPAAASSLVAVLSWLVIYLRIWTSLAKGGAYGEFVFIDRDGKEGLHAGSMSYVPDWFERGRATSEGGMGRK